jgi:hypothetical protein
MPWAEHITTDLPAELELVLRRADYPAFIKRLRSRADEYYFRIHDPHNRVLGRSPAFSGPAERDIAYTAFIDYVEIEIHNRRQRQLNFGFWIEDKEMIQ